MSRKTITIGTRGSRLALWQANHLMELLSEIDVSAELSIIKTKGDKIQNLSFDKIEGKGFFTKEIEDALLESSVDIAVHSLKDMPTEPTSGLCLAGVSYREDASDLLIVRKDVIQSGGPLNLPEKAVIGTSSVRRKSQMKSLLPSCTIKDLRGNVPTRIDKLRQGQYDAIILASAGINRLGLDLSDLHTIRLNPKEFVPAPGQGIVVFQCRENDLEIRRILKKIHKSQVSKCSNIERKVMQLMGGGCHTPLGVYCETDKIGNFHCYAAFAKSDSEPLIRFSLSQSTSYQLAETIAEKLKS